MKVPAKARPPEAMDGQRSQPLRQRLLPWARVLVLGSSMEPSFAPGDQLLVSLRAFQRAVPRRGDVVVAWEPGQADIQCLKRIIGLPGEQVQCEDGRVSINGRPLAEPYVAKPALPEGNVHEWLLGESAYVLLGDRRDNSRDSRAFGPLRRDQIVGKVWLRYWPLRRWRSFAAQGYPSPL